MTSFIMMAFMVVYRPTCMYVYIDNKCGAISDGMWGSGTTGLKLRQMKMKECDCRTLAGR